MQGIPHEVHHFKTPDPKRIMMVGAETVIAMTNPSRSSPKALGNLLGEPLVSIFQFAINHIRALVGKKRGHRVVLRVMHLLLHGIMSPLGMIIRVT